jgi:branched-subunit amino acid aminotransferase/4-amino-4-deoxychorismate lyase
MSVAGDFFQYRDGNLHRVDSTLSETLTVADSFLVHDHQVRTIERHFQRFSSCITDPDTKASLPGFFTSVIEKLDQPGTWFPRIEYRELLPVHERLVLRLREAPERTETLSLWTSDEPDPRKHPLVKGPDLSACQQLRRAANLHGADEAVIVDERGYIADGALSSIVWWHNGVLLGPDSSTHWLPSITRDLVFSIAKLAGYETGETQAKPEDLAGCEVWSLSALQGIRLATSWGDIELAPGKLHQSFAKRLSLMSSPLSKVERNITQPS